MEQNYNSAHPLKRLKPRDAMRECYVDAFALKFIKANFPNDKFYAVSINSLYSFCSLQFPFMIEKYVIIIGKDLERLTILRTHWSKMSPL